MYAFDTSIEIAAPAERVWRALCDPAEVVQWDTGVSGPIDPPPNYPRPGQHVRWRYTNGPFRVLHDRPKEVVAPRKLRSLLSLGPLRFDETYTLEPQGDGVLLTAAMLVWLPVPLAGPLIERWYAGPAARATVGASLRAIKRLCEDGG
ncbi:MAG TPA: SRPBCC family protein [Dehalococcoidia bacterium]|nr:SRPBCC family protein [Dehalococcoidia bacterium]